MRSCDDNFNQSNQRKEYYLHFNDCDEDLIDRLTSISNDNKSNTQNKKNSITLYYLLQIFHKSLSQVKCQKCQGSTLMETTISKLPIYLCFYLKRFSYNHKRNKYEKINTFVDFPEQINVESIVDKESQFAFEFNIKKNECDYELFAVNYHSWNCQNGHYIAYANVRGEWHCFNDNKVSKNLSYNDDDSFILFYKRKIS